jgi:hypothetical protein
MAFLSLFFVLRFVFFLYSLLEEYCVRYSNPTTFLADFMFNAMGENTKNLKKAIHRHFGGK